VLGSLPKKTTDLDILELVLPALQRTTTYLKSNSPTQNMLKFLDVVLADIIAGGYCSGSTEIQEIFYEQLNALTPHLSFCQLEEVFPVFDKLTQMCRDLMDAYTLKKCIHALVEANANAQKVQAKTKAHKATIQ
jgi:hypothetical protein